MHGTMRPRNMSLIQLRATILYFYMKCDHEVILPVPTLFCDVLFIIAENILSM